VLITHTAMFLAVMWTLIVVSSFVDTKIEKRTHPKYLQGNFFLIDTVDGNNYNLPEFEDYQGKCDDRARDKRQCAEYADRCGEDSVAELCRKTCGLCPGEGGGRGNCVDQDKRQCPKYTANNGCNTAMVAQLCRNTCGLC